MHISKNVSLKPYNTFAINASAAYFSSFSNTDDLAELMAFALNKNSMPFMVLGGGSNVLFTADYNGLILKNEMNGIEVVKEDASHVYVKAAAGENWHRFVEYCITNNYAGVENLSLIPGNVGASPMQNIGAYGVEIKDVFYELEAWHLLNNAMQTFKAADCQFGYRESIFKGKYKGTFAITSVTFKLNKKPQFQTSYGAIQHELDRMNVSELSIAAISQAVINIRKSKLPDPAQTGNAGSFFKNPTITLEQFNNLKDKHPAIVGYPVPGDKVKVAAGWLIEQCGWKGYRRGDAGCHKDQALVLVNFGNAQGLDVYTLSTDIMHSVEAAYGIILEREVNIV